MTPKTPKKHKQRFEHGMLSCDFLDILKKIEMEGREGWELVSILPGKVDPYYTHLFFKRPV